MTVEITNKTQQRYYETLSQVAAVYKQTLFKTHDCALLACMYYILLQQQQQQQQKNASHFVVYISRY